MSAAVATVLRFAVGVVTGQDSGAADLLHEEIEIHDFDLPDAGVYRGLAGVERWLADWEAPWEEWSGDVHDVLDLGTQVATLNHLQARTASGLAVDREDSQLYTIRDGKIAKLEYFGEPDAAIERADDPPFAARRREVHGRIRALYRAAVQEDVEGVVALLHPEYEFFPEAGAVMAPAYRGHDGARRYFQETFEAWEILRLDVERLIDAGDGVVALFELRNRGRGSGIELSGRWAELWQTTGTDIVSSRFYQSHEEALAAAGLSPDGSGLQLPSRPSTSD
jgi:ketosteroid isomerase-like protein